MRKYLNGLLSVFAAALLLAAGTISVANIPTTQTPSQIQYQGSVPDQGQLTQYLADIRNNGAPYFGNVSTITSAVSASTALPAWWLPNGLVVLSSTSCTTCTLVYPSAVSFVAAIPGGVNGNGLTWFTSILNYSPGTVTIQGGTGTTIAGTATIARSTVRYFIGSMTTSQTILLSSVYAVSAF